MSSFGSRWLRTELLELKCTVFVFGLIFRIRLFIGLLLVMTSCFYLSKYACKMWIFYRILSLDFSWRTLLQWLSQISPVMTMCDSQISVCFMEKVYFMENVCLMPLSGLAYLYAWNSYSKFNPLHSLETHEYACFCVWDHLILGRIPWSSLFSCPFP